MFSQQNQELIGFDTQIFIKTSGSTQIFQCSSDNLHYKGPAILHAQNSLYESHHWINLHSAYSCTITYPDHSTYIGSIFQLKPHGFGKSSSYEGQFENGVKSGVGIKINGEEQFYVHHVKGKIKRLQDEMDQSLINIQNEYQRKFDLLFSSLENQVKSVEKVNPETQFNNTKSLKSITMKRDSYNHEVFTDENGDYEGLTLNGNKIIGKHTFKDGSSYAGQFENNKREGFGIMKYRDGTSYRGQWKNDQKCGVGELMDGESEVNCDRYLGEFLDDKKEGYGIEIHKNGSKSMGIWKENELNGESICVGKNGDFYFGKLESNMKCGFGVECFLDGNGVNLYIGEWLKDKMHGKGKLLAQNGFLESKDFENGKIIE